MNKLNCISLTLVLDICYLVRALKAFRNYFVYNIHKIFCFPYNMINFNERSSFSDRVIFYCKLKSLDKGGHSIQYA